ncbi:MAG: hypothetical protein JXA06_12255 [Bacteroidetes bacterium]|nr:hypothetical protein [Bacteroidota bacterium]
MESIKDIPIPRISQEPTVSGQNITGGSSDTTAPEIIPIKIQKRPGYQWQLLKEHFRTHWLAYVIGLVVTVIGGFLVKYFVETPSKVAVNEEKIIRLEKDVEKNTIDIQKIEDKTENKIEKIKEDLLKTKDDVKRIEYQIDKKKK